MPRAKARPRAGTRPGMPGPAVRRARAAAGRGAPAASLLSLAASLAASLAPPDFTSRARAPRAAAAAATAAAAAAAAASSAPQPGALLRAKPQHCLPLNSLRATCPSRSLPGSWADPGPGLLRSWGKGPSLRASVSSSVKWALETHVIGLSGELTETIVGSAKLPGIE